MKTSSDSRLLSALARGDMRGAGELLVKEHAAAVLDLCSAMVRDAQRAEDLTQDVFGNAFVALPRFRAEASVRTWLLRIARNHCIDHLRAHRIEARPDSDAVAQEWDDAPLPTELLGRRDLVERALLCLAEGERALVVLRFKSGLEYAELAEAFDLKQGTVRMRISRALAKMRSALDLPTSDARAPSATLRAAPCKATAPRGFAIPSPGRPARIASPYAARTPEPGAAAFARVLSQILPTLSEQLVGRLLRTVGDP